MKNKKHLLLVILIFIGAFGIAQSIKVDGIVKDDNNQPLPGASIIVKGTSNGVTTDFDGNFSITTEKGNVLVVSYIGYQKKEVAVKDSYVTIILQSGEILKDIVVVGSRNPNRMATETTAPVDVISVSDIAKAIPQVNVNQILNYVAPSFTSNVQNIADGTDHIDPASLRGLGPDQVLVLINGKRRHTSSLINVNGTFGRGNVGTDLNAIPAAAIKRIEVLRDGAAAQYGSDAIAGVINIVLKDNINELSLNITSGINQSSNANSQTGGFDGATTNISANYGIPLGKRNGYVNFTGDFDVRQDYSRMKEWEGTIFNAYNAIENEANKSGFDIKELPTELASIKRFGASVPYFSEDLKSTIANATNITSLQDPLEKDVTDEELKARGQKRSDYNMRVGQSALRGGRFFANLSLPVSDNTEIYAFSGVSSRKGNSAGFYRLPNQARTYTPFYINGFLPEINSDIIDKSLAAGIKGTTQNGWNIDFSNTYGINSFLYTIDNTSNASLQSSSPTSFRAGGFSFAQNTTNLDFNKFYENVMSGLNVAFGTEYRVETYEIYAGQESSYSRYTSEGERIVLPTQTAATDFFGDPRPGAAQVFPGFKPENALSKTRSSIAGYIDLEADITKSFLVNAATRFENYSDFGSTTNFKLATLLKLNDNINLRAAANTGFRAPSLHQLNFNSVSTVFENGIPQDVGTFSNDSRIAKLLGIPKLKQETSKSISAGVSVKVPNANLKFTIDAYFVNIDNRVVYTGQFEKGKGGQELDGLLEQANASAAAFFANAINTDSKGTDIVITHNWRLNSIWSLQTDLSGTFSKTQRVGGIHSSDVLKKAGLEETYFPETSRVYLEEAVPMTKGNLSFTLASDKCVMFFRNVYFGQVKESSDEILLQQVFSPKVVTDLSITYNFTKTLGLTWGVNNLLDIYPDRMAQTFDGIDGNNRSGGRFDWSRRSQQFGIGGRFIFARLSFTIL